MSITGTLKDVRYTSNDDKKEDLTLDLSDLETANESNRDTITEAISTTETNLKEHNTDIETSLTTLINNFEENMESRLTDIDERLNKLDKKFSEILGYSDEEGLVTEYNDSLKGIVGDVTTLKGTLTGTKDDNIEDSTLVGVLQTINSKIGDVSVLKGPKTGIYTDDIEIKTLSGINQEINYKIGDVSTLKKPILNPDTLEMEDPLPIDDKTLAGANQHSIDKIGDYSEIVITVGEVIDPTTGLIVEEPESYTLPPNLGAQVRGSVLNSSEAVIVEKDFRGRFMVPLYESFKKLMEVLLMISQTTPRL